MITVKPSYDVIIPVYHPGEKFSRVLSMLRAQTLKPSRIILMQTVEEGEDVDIFPGCEVYRVLKKEFDHAATRREGVILSSAPYFLMMTDDAIPYDERMCETLIYSLIRTGSAMCYARQVPENGTGETERYTRLFNYPDTSFTKTAGDIGKLGIKAYFSSDVCCAYDRKVYEETGGFIDHAIFNEDMIYACKVLGTGKSVRYEASARVIHSHNYTPAQQFHRNFDLGMSQKMNPDVFSGIRSEGEGLKLVTGTMKHLIRKGRWYEIPKLITDSAAKYAGYRLGKSYDRLPKKLSRKLSMNKTFCERYL